jgi:hypothetical protein
VLLPPLEEYERKIIHLNGAPNIAAPAVEPELPVNGFAVVAQSELREPLGISGLLGAFRPCVAIGVKRNVGDAEAVDPAPEFFRAIRSCERVARLAK